MVLRLQRWYQYTTKTFPITINNINYTIINHLTSSVLHIIYMCIILCKTNNNILIKQVLKVKITLLKMIFYEEVFLYKNNSIGLSAFFLMINKP